MSHVAIVFDPAYAGLLKLAFHSQVWLIESPQNRAAAENAWHEAVEWPHISVTMFRFDDWRELLAQIGPVDGADVIGTRLTTRAREALEDAGFMRFDVTSDGFRARKT